MELPDLLLLNLPMPQNMLGFTAHFCSGWCIVGYGTGAMYAQGILLGISKGSFEIPHRISYP